MDLCTFCKQPLHGDDYHYVPERGDAEKAHTECCEREGPCFEYFKDDDDVIS